MYSPAERPSSIRAAPAKNLIWSTIGGISSDLVSPTGLPVFSDSAATNSSARASMASAIRSSARLRSAGVVSRQASFRRSGVPPGLEGRRGGGEGSVDIGGLGDRRRGERLAGARVDQLSRPAGRGVGPLAADEVTQIFHLKDSVLCWCLR